MQRLKRGKKRIKTRCGDLTTDETKPKSLDWKRSFSMGGECFGIEAPEL